MIIQLVITLYMLHILQIRPGSTLLLRGCASASGVSGSQGLVSKNEKTIQNGIYEMHEAS